VIIPLFLFSVIHLRVIAEGEAFTDLKMGSTVSSNLKMCTGRPLHRRDFNNIHRLKQENVTNKSSPTAKRRNGEDIRRLSSAPAASHCGEDANGGGGGSGVKDGGTSTAAAVAALTAPEITERQKVLVVETWVLVEEHISEVRKKSQNLPLILK